jgi:hypothetical protein
VIHHGLHKDLRGPALHGNGMYCAARAQSLKHALRERYRGRSLLFDHTHKNSFPIWKIPVAMTQATDS